MPNLTLDPWQVVPEGFVDLHEALAATAAFVEREEALEIRWAAISDASSVAAFSVSHTAGAPTTTPSTTALAIDPWVPLPSFQDVDDATAQVGGFLEHEAPAGAVTPAVIAFGGVTSLQALTAATIARAAQQVDIAYTQERVELLVGPSAQVQLVPNDTASVKFTAIQPGTYRAQWVLTDAAGTAIGPGILTDPFEVKQVQDFALGFVSATPAQIAWQAIPDTSVVNAPALALAQGLVINLEPMIDTSGIGLWTLTMDATILFPGVFGSSRVPPFIVYLEGDPVPVAARRGITTLNDILSIILCAG